MPKKALRNFLFGVQPGDLTVASANINDEQAQGAIAFGQLLESVGKGVAESQQQLNDMTGELATAFAETGVTAVVAQEEIFDDNGTLVGGKSYTSQLPLINFMDVPIYEWTKVRLSGNFVTQEQSTATATNRTDLHLDASGSGGKGRKPKFTLNIAASNQNVGTSSSSDVSIAHVRMGAVLESNKRLTVPKPVVSTNGPRLDILAGKVDRTDDARTILVTFKYGRIGADGSPIAIPSKTLSIETSGIPWALSAGGPAPTTDANGEVVCTLRRDFPDGDGKTAPPGSFGVTALIGMISANLTVII